MHRHGYQGRKFHRERDEREALIQSLAEALIVSESIETTLPKAKEIVPYVEKLITKAKKGDLANRRLILAKLQTISSAHKLVDELAPKLQGRNSGHLRIERTRLRRGDHAQMARVSFVQDSGTPKTPAKQPAKEKEPAEKDDAKQAAKPASQTAAQEKPA
jgi:large subunit ribosomal protein L17